MEWLALVAVIGLIVWVEECSYGGRWFTPLVDVAEPDRTVVALSKDQKWLVVHHLGTGRWLVYDACHWGYQEYTTVEDTGQSAEDVLTAFLTQQEVGNGPSSTP